MQADTITLIHKYYDYFNKQDVESFLALLDNQVIHDINQGVSEVGFEAFSHFMKRMNNAYQEKVTDLVIMTNQDGSRASAEFIIDGIYLATDSDLPKANHQPYSLRCGAFFEIKNNKIMRVTNYYNMQDWLKQVKE